MGQAKSNSYYQTIQSHSTIELGRQNISCIPLKLIMHDFKTKIKEIES